LCKFFVPVACNKNFCLIFFSFVMEIPQTTVVNERDSSSTVNNNTRLDNLIWDQNNQERRSWVFFGSKIPRSQVLFVVQVILIVLIVTVAIVNLTLSKTCEETTVWIAILSSSVGYMLPSPKL